MALVCNIYFLLDVFPFWRTQETKKNDSTTVSLLNEWFAVDSTVRRFHLLFFFNSFGFVLLHSISKANVTDRKGRWRVRESTIRKKKEKMRKYLLKNSKKFIGNQIVRHGGRGQSRLATNQTGGRGKEKRGVACDENDFFFAKTSVWRFFWL